MVFLMNYYYSIDRSETFGLISIYTTDYASHTISEYTKCSGDFLDGGFKNLGPCKGRYLIIARTGPGMSWNDRLYINEVRVYSVPNLLEGATVIETPTPKDNDLSANNLIENQETRSA